MEKNKRLMPTRMVIIDEDERECLRRLAESSTTTRTHQHKTKHVTNINNNSSHARSRLSSSNNNKVQDIHVIADHDDDYDILEEKKVVTQKPNKKLETKQSEDINESAEKFIQQFRQQLILQRLESIENVEKMLERGL